ncbi:hypothetical protein J4477_04220 [Candidatus Pacearchaeota archaeon]|nr:hypothetical protein [Candidatus Pacearchaeota archaeon]
MNKKGDWLVEEVAKVILAIVLLVLLAYLALTLYQSITQKSQLEQARVHLDNIENIVSSLEEGEKKDYILLSPSGWALYGFPYGEHNVRSCQVSNKPCICLCPETKLPTWKYRSELFGQRIPSQDEIYKEFSESCQSNSACKPIDVGDINVNLASQEISNRAKTSISVNNLIESKSIISISKIDNKLFVIDKNEQES